MNNYCIIGLKPQEIGLKVVEIWAVWCRRDDLWSPHLAKVPTAEIGYLLPRWRCLRFSSTRDWLISVVTVMTQNHFAWVGSSRLAPP